MSSKHTPEPWSVFSPMSGNYNSGICGNSGNVIVPWGEPELADGILNKEDANRIVACVNACAGLANDALDSGIIAEMTEIVGILENDNETLPAWLWNRIKAVKAKI